MGSSVLIDLGQIAQQIELPVASVEAAVRLLDEGNTVPFITRYRRDQTGGLDEVAIRRISECVTKVRQLAERRQTILRTIQGQGKLTSDLEQRIKDTQNSKQLEDLYLPYKPRKLSLAEIARQRRLEPLAKEILSAEVAVSELDKRAADFIDEDLEVSAVADVLLGVGHIIAHDFSEQASLRQQLRRILGRSGRLRSQRVQPEGKSVSKDAKHYRDYFEFSEYVDRLPPHRVLAINRGERARLLKVKVEGAEDDMQVAAEKILIPEGHPHKEFLQGCVRDSLQRLVLPSLEREMRREITEACEAHAVAVFARNLRNLLLQPPVPNRRVLAIDPGFKSGCKVVVIDEYGSPVEHAVLHIIGQDQKKKSAAEKITEMVKNHQCNVIAIGNGTAGREVESLVAELVTGPLQPLDVAYVIVNEAGASVYSTSSYARDELPGYEAAIRGSISIGRRLQDPLSELVKIEPANIGVGLYQHDVKARHLHTSLDNVIESCVNYVGVDVNTASPALLRYVSGLNQATARNLHEWRTSNGPFRTRKQLLDVPGFGESAFVQSAGFLKISDGEDPFDSTWIHPESYDIAQQALSRLGGEASDLRTREGAEKLLQKSKEFDLDSLAEELGVGRLLLSDIIEQLLRPGRDPREDLPQPFFKKGVLKLEDLEVGMELQGSVLNVVDFGAFIDIGLHDSGMVHISQLSQRYVRDPHDIVCVGEVVKVWVLEIDKTRRRVALTMIKPGSEPKRSEQVQRTPRGVEKAPESNTQEKKSQRHKRPRRKRGSRKQTQDRKSRTYSATPKKTAAPITQEMREGKEPLRTFGDLKQFLDGRDSEEAER